MMAYASETNDMASIDKEQALCNAAKSGDCETITKLLDLKVSVEAENLCRKLYSLRKNWETPLQIAAGNGHFNCVQMLLYNGANVDARDRFHYTALHLAAAYGKHQCLRALLEAGADGDVPLLDHPESPHVSGTTALHFAAKYNRVDCVKELLNSGVNYNAIDKNGHTSLYTAAKFGFNNCVLAHLKHIRGCRNFLPVRLDPSFDTSDTPLHFAVKHRMLECVKYLVRLGSDVNRINSAGFSPLHLVWSQRDDEVLNLISWKNDPLRRISGFECYARNEDTEFTQLTPTHYADRLRSIKMEILKCLLREGYEVDVNIATKRGKTALYYPVFSAYDPEMAALLIANGASIDIKEYGLTVLEYRLSIARAPLILKHVVNAMPQLPHLRSLNVRGSILNAQDSEHEQGYAAWHSQVLPKNREFRLVRDKADVYVEMRDSKIPVTEARCPNFCFNATFTSIFPSTRYRLEEPLLSLIYERIVDEIKQFGDCLGRGGTLDGAKICYKNKLENLENCLRYEIMASNPRTLQDCCRFCIRKCIGTSNLNLIRKLPLPKKLNSYLLFECDV